MSQYKGFDLSKIIFKRGTKLKFIIVKIFYMHFYISLLLQNSLLYDCDKMMLILWATQIK